MFIQTKLRPNLPSDTLYVEYKVKNPDAKRTTIILLPGGPGGDHSIYREQVDTLFQHVDTVMFDPRGCGKSTISHPNGYHIQTYIDDVEEIRNQLELDDVIILGTSYGSMAAQGYAIQYGQSTHLRALILVCGSASYEFIQTAQTLLDDIGTDEQIAQFQQLLDGDITTDDMLRHYFKVMTSLYTNAKPGDFRSATKEVRYNAQAANAGFAPNGFLRKFDWRKQLSQINCPTQIIFGANDWINHPKNSEEMAALIPNAKLNLIPDSKHLVWVDQKEKYFGCLTHFLQSLNLESNIE